VVLVDETSMSDASRGPGWWQAEDGLWYPPEVDPDRPHRSGCLSVVGNVLWLIFAGWELAIGYLVAALIMVVFVITIPFAVQSVKLAGYSLWPFGRTIIDDPDGPPPVSRIGNILWFVLCGWWLALGHFIAGVLLLCTVIGIPFGIQSFKLGVLALWPFGKRIVPA
jgi:uncharacterized membrane protein YccF (DUF307 family)